MMMFRSNKPTDDAIDLFDAIQNDVYDALDLVGAQIVDDWREEISIDVEYRGSVVVKRSSPGQPPRRETGALHDSVDSEMEADDAALTLTVGITADVPYGYWLESGTGNIAPRPHRDPIFDKWGDEVIDAVLHAIETPSGR